VLYAFALLKMHFVFRVFACGTHRRTQDFTMEGIHMVGGQGVWGTEVPSMVQGKAPMGDLGTRPQKLSKM